MTVMIPYGKQNISKEDIDSVVKILKSDWITQGPCVESFEEAISQKVGSKYCISANSATSCLHLACKALDLKRGERVWTSPNSFVASANAALFCGADIDFVDIDPITYNMCCDKLEEKLIKASKNNLLPKILIPVHFGGQSCDMERIYNLSLKYNFKIIEDASHAIGSKYKNKYVGNCKYSSITVFSFHPVKIITTAEGGAATTNDPLLAQNMYRNRSHGIERIDENNYDFYKSEIWNYKQISLGFNYRLNDIQAALGLSQINRLDKFVSHRQSIAKIYDNELNMLSIKLPKQVEYNYSSYHLYPIRVSQKKGGISQKKLYSFLRSNNIGVNLHYIPIYRQPYFQNLGFKKGYCIEAEDHFKEVVSIPIYYGLSESNQEYIIEKIKEVYSN